MRWFLRLLATLQLLLSGCNSSRLPSEYRQIPVPTTRIASLEAVQNGRGLFLEHCAICHGERGDGRGRRRNLSSRPQDFTDPAWRSRSTPRWLFYVIREGKQGTAMAGWKTLDHRDTWDLVAYLLSLAGQGP
jgi:mono/diheme cytochrome c family protein